MLNKEICKYCRDQDCKQRGAEIPDKIFVEKEQEFVNCPPIPIKYGSHNFNVESILWPTGGDPPPWCLYDTEHVVSMGIDDTQDQRLP
jgi:hypothetical protein